MLVPDPCEPGSLLCRPLDNESDMIAIKNGLYELLSTVYLDKDNGEKEVIKPPIIECLYSRVLPPSLNTQPYRNLVGEVPVRTGKG